jgi:hypothetical protein
MHRPRSSRVVTAMKWGSWLFLCASILLLATVLVLGFAFYNGQKSILLPALIGVFLALSLLLAYRLVSSSARCPLCATPVLLHNGCQKNKKAEPLMGSYRFRVARDIALLGAFRCPYCGEDSLCMVKERPE